MRDKHMAKKKKGKSKGNGGCGGQKWGRKCEKLFFFFSSLLSKIYGNRTVGFLRSKRQSWSMHRKLHVGTKILEFHQTL